MGPSRWRAYTAAPAAVGPLPPSRNGVSFSGGPPDVSADGILGLKGPPWRSSGAADKRQQQQQEETAAAVGPSKLPATVRCSLFLGSGTLAAAAAASGAPCVLQVYQRPLTPGGGAPAAAVEAFLSLKVSLLCLFLAKRTANTNSETYSRSHSLYTAQETLLEPTGAGSRGLGFRV